MAPTSQALEPRKWALLQAAVAKDASVGLMPTIPKLLPPGSADGPNPGGLLYLELTGRPALYHLVAGEPAGLHHRRPQRAGLLPGRDCHLLPFRTKQGGKRLATFVYQLLRADPGPGAHRQSEESLCGH